MGFMTSLGSVPYFKDGRLLPLAVASAKRLPQLPDVPTMAEVGLAGLEIDSWSGLLAPANTPPAIVEQLQREVAKALASPDVNGQLASQGAVVVGSTPAAFSAFLANEYKNYGTLIRSINLELN
jgi:tripartite-type tricarboxylate transporter receptor subunit TctC